MTVVRLLARWDLIQTIRLAQAIGEGRHTVEVGEPARAAYEHLAARFDFRWTVGAPAAELPVGIDHATPETSVGSCRRPLVLPHAVVQRCGETWSTDRDLPVSFAGLVTPQRKAVLEDWLARALGRHVEVPLTRRPGRPSLGERVRRKVLGPRDRGVRALADAGIHLWSSERGRSFPTKAFDDAYFQRLGRSAYVLCPNGDHVWSYRFFEAILCGAIPVVEGTCAAYDGFTFRTLDDLAPGEPWDAAVAEANAALARTRLTVPTEELDAAVDEALR